MKRVGYRRLAASFVIICLCFVQARASVSLLMEEPFGTFGAFNPTGHAALYFSGICADEPTQVRLCRPGELGVVISRYHRINGYDWLAMPLVPYLFAVEDLADVPQSVTPDMEATLRDTYRRDHLLDIAPTLPDGSMPPGEWVQLIGASYDRRIYGFQLATTRQQNAMLVARLNDRHNTSHFNIMFNNCADFSRNLLRLLYPDTIPRNALADFGLTTPKHLAHSVQRVGERHPELDYQTFLIPQVPGTLKRSHHVNGIAESLVRSKKYLVPLAFVSPTTAVSLMAAYISTGRFRPPDDAPPMPELAVLSGDDMSLDNGIVMDDFYAASVKNASSRLACIPPKMQQTVAQTVALQIVRGGGF